MVWVVLVKDIFGCCVAAVVNESCDLMEIKIEMERMMLRASELHAPGAKASCLLIYRPPDASYSSNSINSMD